MSVGDFSILGVHSVNEVVDVPVLLPPPHLVNSPTDDGSSYQQESHDERTHDSEGDQPAPVATIPAAISSPLHFLILPSPASPFLRRRGVREVRCRRDIDTFRGRGVHRVRSAN